MKRVFLSMLAVASLIFTSCSSENEDSSSSVTAPDTYTFTRDGETSVSFSGQTTRIAMAEELFDALLDETKTSTELLAMLAHEQNNTDFSDADLNSASNQIWNKLAESVDYFKDDLGELTDDSGEIRDFIEALISDQATTVFPYWVDAATAGNAGQLVSGDKTRYVDAQGVELDQFFAKGLIGTLMTDQILNDYLTLSQSADNETVGDSNYTTMEHYWDEAYGYLYGAEEDTTSPELNADSFLNKYLSSVDSDSDFTGIAATIFDAFKLGRAAIVAQEYDVRDEQIEIIRENISKVIGVRAVYYLQSGKTALEADNVDHASAFHSISEGLGFVYSLQFTRKANVTTPTPYFTKTQVDSFIDQLLEPTNGLWDGSTAATLGDLAEEIAAEFDFTVEEAL